MLSIFQKKTNAELESLINSTKRSMQNNYKEMPRKCPGFEYLRD